MTGDGAQMGSLLARMTSADPTLSFTSSQVRAVVEVLIPKIVTEMPGMPAGMRCDVEADESGWTLRVRKP